MRLTCVIVAALSLAVLRLAAAGQIERSISTSRQFIVYGSDARLRGAICDLAEQTKLAALRVLGEQDAWKTPILINAQLPQANFPEMPRAQLKFGQTGFGLKLQLDLSIDADINAPAVQRELLRAVFLEMMYRAAPNTPPGTAYAEPPDWLLDGTLALAPGADHAEIAAALESPRESGKIMSLPEFLRQRRDLLDSPSRALYRAYSAALISLLTETADGRLRLARYVAALPLSSTDSMADLKAHFPVLAKEEQQEKEWKMTVTRLASSERYRPLSCEETEQELQRILRLELRERDGSLSTYTLDEYPKFIQVPAAASALRRISDELLLLSGRANPLYHPVLGEYEKLAALLARGKSKKMSTGLGELRGMREQIARRMSAVSDYLNWFEATQSRTASGAFHEYMRAAEAAAAERAYRRHDAISVYLDALEAQF